MLVYLERPAVSMASKLYFRSVGNGGLTWRYISVLRQQVNHQRQQIPILTW